MVQTLEDRRKMRVASENIRDIPGIEEAYVTKDLPHSPGNIVMCVRVHERLVAEHPRAFPEYEEKGININEPLLNDIRQVAAKHLEVEPSKLHMVSMIRSVDRVLHAATVKTALEQGKYVVAVGRRKFDPKVEDDGIKEIALASARGVKTLVRWFRGG